MRDRLCPVLKAGGADVLIDVERFGAGIAVHKQMDELQDRAQIHLLVLSPDYLASRPCLHEMQRAVASDPLFNTGSVLPLVRVGCELPPEIKVPETVTRSEP